MGPRCLAGGRFSPVGSVEWKSPGEVGECGAQTGRARRDLSAHCVQVLTVPSEEEETEVICSREPIS